VVGVAAAYLRKGESLNFAVPLRKILTLKQTKPISLALWSHSRRRPDATDFFLEGLASMKLGDCGQGLQSFRLAVVKSPHSAWAWWGMGVCLTQLNVDGQAVVALKRAIALDPTLGAPHFALGLTYLAEGKSGPARREYQALKSLDPELAKRLAANLAQQGGN
jgi:Flp pilus assembly protein TadD